MKFGGCEGLDGTEKKIRAQVLDNGAVSLSDALWDVTFMWVDEIIGRDKGHRTEKLGNLEDRMSPTF